MKSAVFLGLAVALTMAMQASALAALTSSQLVYAFTYSSAQNVTARDSPNGIESVGTQSATGMPLAGTVYTGTPDNGISHYAGNLSDKGTMTVNLLRQQNDGGLVVTIREQGQGVRRAPEATCVVYGNTQVICDPSKTVYTEEYTLLRFLGTNFVDPSRLDANRHWTITQQTARVDVTSDYVVDGNSGGLMQIGDVRNIKPAGGGGNMTTNVQTKIGYDAIRSIPTSVDEYVTQRQDTGLTGTSTTVYQTTLALQTASVAKQ